MIRKINVERAKVIFFTVLCMFAILIGHVPGLAATPEVSQEPKKVLVIPSYNFNYLGSQWFLQGVIKEFTEHGNYRIVYLQENLQLAAKAKDTQYIENIAAALKIKYSMEKPDVIIVQYRQAIEFMIRYGAQIFGDIPVVVAGLEAEKYTNVNFPFNYTGTLAAFSTQRNIELIVHNHPAVKKIYVVGGVSPVERDMVNIVVDVGRRITKGIEFVTPNQLTAAELLAQIKGLGSDTVILYQAYQTDAAGKIFVPAEFAEEIARVSPVPVYGMLDTFMGSGIIGGYLVDHELLGRRAADLASKILTGHKASGTVSIESLGTYRFDWRQLERFRVDEYKLPTDSKIEFKEQTAWDLYKREIIVTILLILIQGLFIIGLLKSRFRRMKAEMQLRNSEERLKKAIAVAPFPIMIRADDGEIIQISDVWTEITGYAHADIPTIEKWVENAYSENLETMRKAVITNYDWANRTNLGECAVRTKDGSTRIWDFSYASIGLLSDGRRAAIAMAIDVTERKRAETERSEAQKRAAFMERMASLGTLAAGVAHEINQPLQALKTSADALNYWHDRGHPLDTEKTMESMRRISAQADRISKIVKRMRVFVNESAPEAPSAVNLNEVVTQGLEFLRARLKSHGIRITENLKATASVLGEKQRLEEVIINIVANAMQALDAAEQKDKEIILSTYNHNNCAILEISNNGPAISEKVMGRIFDPFFSTKGPGENMGLGLSIVHAIIESHNGAIQVESDDRGVRFKITFPTCPDK